MPALRQLARPGLLLALWALSAAPAPAGAAGITNTRHDLSANNGAAAVHAATEKGTCIFCHAPHHASQQKLLWNHKPSTRPSYSWDPSYWVNGTTMYGTTLPTGITPGAKNAVQAPSMRCLACHDGSVALGAVNAMTGGSAGTIGLSAVSGPVDATGHLIDPTYTVGVGGDLTDNHPISIPYAASTYYGQPSGVPSSLVDNLANHYWMIKLAACGSPSGICTQATGAPLNGSAINLISDGSGGVGVECTTCHEPHNKYGFAFFARVDTQNQSALCRSCHNK